MPASDLGVAGEVAKYLGSGIEMVVSSAFLVVAGGDDVFFVFFETFLVLGVFDLGRGGFDAVFLVNFRLATLLFAPLDSPRTVSSFALVSIDSFSDLGAIEYSTDPGPGAALPFRTADISSL